jgi:ferredoxin
MAYTAHIDTAACSGHGDCEDIAPEIFRVDHDVATVVGTGPDEFMLEAARACPSVAIVVTDDSGRQIFP